MYSKKFTKPFKPEDIRLLSSINDMYQRNTGEGIDSEYMGCSNREVGETLQMVRYPDNHYSIGSLNSTGSGTQFFSSRVGSIKEGVDFEFI
jgi:hypothetical protein